MKYIICITSGYVNPLHSGHINLINGMIKWSNNYNQWEENIVITYFIVNNDKQVSIKKSIPFMNESERCFIIKHIKGINHSMISIDEDNTVSKSIEKICQEHLQDGSEREFYFFKGGDRSDSSKMPQSELDVCKKYNIEIVYGCGGFNKANSSSEILRKVRENNV